MPLRNNTCYLRFDSDACGFRQLSSKDFENEEFFETGQEYRMIDFRVLSSETALYYGKHKPGFDAERDTAPHETVFSNDTVDSGKFISIKSKTDSNHLNFHSLFYLDSFTE